MCLIEKNILILEELRQNRIALLNAIRLAEEKLIKN